MLKLLLKLLLTAVALWLAFRNVEWNELKDAVTHQEIPFLIATVGAVLIQTLCGGIRWHWIRLAQGDETSNLTSTTTAYMASSFFNICFPSTVGSDVARTWIARRLGGSLKEVIAGVVIDRIMSLIAVAMVVATTLPWLFTYLHINPGWGVGLAVFCWLALILCYVVLRAIVRFLEDIINRAVLMDVVTALGRMVGKHWPLLISLLWAMAAHIAYAAAAYGLALSTHTPISWMACATLVPLVLFISALPISLGGWGLREVGMTGLLALVGVPSAQALVISIQLGLITTLVGLFGGLFYLSFRKTA